MADIRDYDDIYEYARDQEIENEQFWGTDLNEAKAEKLKRMQEMCMAIADADSTVRYQYLVFDNSCRNASVQVVFPNIYTDFDGEVKSLLSKLYDEADHIWMSAATGEILLTFSIKDMWNKPGKK